MEGELSRMTTATYIEKTVVEVPRRSKQGRQLGGERMNTTNSTIPIMCMGTSPAVLTETMHDDLMERKRQSLEEMCSAVEDVVECLYKEEWELFEKKVSEWPISFQFYYYMRAKLSHKFRGYQMDGEYNHMTNGFKREIWAKMLLCDGKILSVRPDFLVHRRSPAPVKDRKSPRNLLWVEIKRHGGNQLEDDRKKLCAVTSKMNDDIEEVSGYEVGLSLLLLKKHVHCEWFQLGQKVKYRVGVVCCTSPHSIRWEDKPVRDENEKSEGEENG